MSKVLINTFEKEIARKQKQLAKVESEIDMWINGYSVLHDGYVDMMRKTKQAIDKGDYEKALRILEQFEKKQAEIVKVLQKDLIELVDKKCRLESEIIELQNALHLQKRKEI